MSALEIENTGPEQTRSRGNPAWQPGVSGNPDGRPKGARNKTTLAVEQLLDGEAEAITRKAIELAKQGDIQAIRICMDRLCPSRKDRPVTFALPKLESAADAVGAAAVGNPLIPKMFGRPES